MSEAAVALVVAILIGVLTAVAVVSRMRRTVLVPPARPATRDDDDANPQDKPTKVFTAAEVAAHDDPSDAWVIIEGKVYDITRYIDEHPGGAAIMNNLGADSTVGFNGPQHARETVLPILDMYYVGDLASSS